MAITFNSCTKERESGGSKNGSTKLVKTLTGDDGYYTEFFYDKQQHLIKVINEEVYVTFTYNKDKITQEDHYNGYTTIYTLDNKGYVIRSDDYDDGVHEHYTTHEYSNGYLVKSTSDGGYTTYTWQNGNLTKIVEDGGVQQYTEILTYNNIENKWNYDPYFAELSLIFKGVTSKNYLVKLTASSGFTSTLKYTYDSDGYPTKIVISSSYGGSETITITYY